ncbi:TrmB family transcriptional regulator [Halobacteriales archaeon QS_8_69_26]|nr:MAG: TrmB family transcriptional regulator [Halobacteriales archaeon QS_8_69_26]
MVDDPREEAVDLLREFGLTEYQAWAFVGLAGLGSGTAKEVSEAAGIPQARVYDCMEALSERGLVDVRNTQPRRFRAVSVDRAVDLLRRRYEEHAADLETRLSRLGTPDVPQDGPGVWSIGGRDGVAERLAGLVGDADAEVRLAVADGSVLTGDVVAALSGATDRGVAVLFGSPDERLRARVDGEVPDASVVETWTWWDSLPIDAGSVSAALQVDDAATLAAVVEDPPGADERDHRAVWADDVTAPLVSVLRPLLAAAISGRRWPPED